MLSIIGGKYKKRTLATPKSEKVRPTTAQLRETLFNICQHTTPGARFLDLFAGSGAMGLEALSRGALHATFVECDRSALAAIKKNIATLHVEQMTTVYSLDVSKALQHLHDKNESFDLIYIDPPYGQGLGAHVLDFSDRHHLLASGGSIFIEDSELHEPTLQQLRLFRQKKVGRGYLYEYRIISTDV